MEYSELEKRLFSYTNGWEDKYDGKFPLSNRAERDNAVSILKQHYNNVDGAHLDYDNGSIEGVDYKVEFAEAVEPQIQEEEITEDAPEKKRKRPLAFTPDKGPQNAILINGRDTDVQGPVSGGGMGESFEKEDNELMAIEDRLKELERQNKEYTIEYQELCIIRQNILDEITEREELKESLNLKENYHDDEYDITTILKWAMSDAGQGNLYRCVIEQSGPNTIEATNYNDRDEYEFKIKFNLLNREFDVTIIKNGKKIGFMPIEEFINDENYFDVNKMTDTMRELEPYYGKEDLSNTNVQQELMALGFDKDWVYTFDDGTYLSVQEFPNNYEQWWIRYDDGKELHDQRFRTFKDLKSYLGEFQESLNESLILTEEKQSKAFKVASLVANLLEGECGPNGGYDPRVYDKGANGADVILWSQMPQERYHISPDLSVVFDFDSHNVDDYEDYGFESKDDAIQFFKENCHWNNIKEWLTDDVSFTWAGDISRAEIQEVLNQIDALNDDEDIIDFNKVDDRDELVHKVFAKEISILENDGFKYISPVTCMQFAFGDGSSILIAFPGRYSNIGIQPWRILYMKNGKKIKGLRFSSFDKLYDYMTDYLDEDLSDVTILKSYTPEETAWFKQNEFILEELDGIDTWIYKYDDGAHLEIYKWRSYTISNGNEQTGETWEIEFYEPSGRRSAFKECKNFHEVVAYMEEMSESLNETKKEYIATNAYPAPELRSLGFESRGLGRYYNYKYDEDCSITIYPPGEPDKSNVKNDQHWTFEYLDFNQPEDGKWKVHRNFNTYDELLKFIYENLGESLKETIEKHDELNSDIWDENKEIKPEVKEKLLDIVAKFKENLLEDDIELDIKDIVIIGSNASYNYTKDSDIDMHIVADLSDYDECEDLAMKLYQAYKSLFNNKYDPTIRGHEVELYVENGSIGAKSSGMYSILSNQWLKEPVKNDIPEVNQKEVDDLVKPFIDRANDARTIDDIDELIDDIYVLRQEGMLEDGEYSIKNLAFKEFRNKGYLNKLKDKKVELENDEMSIR